MPTTRRSTSAATTATALRTTSAAATARYRESGSLRIIVDPSKARVYVDGYYAGIVDDFDGVFQRLNIPPGRHEITLKLEGYRTQHFKVYVPVGDTIKIHYDMVPAAARRPPNSSPAFRRTTRAREDMNDRDDGATTPRRRTLRGPRRHGRATPASVRLQVSPPGRFGVRGRRVPRLGPPVANLRLRPGRHRIEVVRPGFRTVEREVEVEPGRSTEVEVELEKM